MLPQNCAPVELHHAGEKLLPRNSVTRARSFCRGTPSLGARTFCHGTDRKKEEVVGLDNSFHASASYCPLLSLIEQLQTPAFSTPPTLLPATRHTIKSLSSSSVVPLPRRPIKIPVSLSLGPILPILQPVWFRNGSLSARDLGEDVASRELKLLGKTPLISSCAETSSLELKTEREATKETAGETNRGAAAADVFLAQERLFGWGWLAVLAPLLCAPLQTEMSRRASSWVQYRQQDL